MVLLGLRGMAFGEVGQQVARWRPSLDQMVRHHHVNYILGPALRHVTGDAIFGPWMRASRDKLAKSSGVALAAHLRVMADGSFGAWDAMRVVAGLAGQRSLTFAKTDGFSEPVGGTADNFKLVVVSGAGRMIEGQFEIGQMFTRNEGKRSAIEAPDRGQERPCWWSPGDIGA